MYWLTGVTSSINTCYAREPCIPCIQKHSGVKGQLVPNREAEKAKQFETDHVIKA